MIIKKIVLRNYRNYTNLSLTFSPKLNIIVGDNGVGKTNIVEAIQFLSLARSFRTRETNDLIRENCQFGTIEAKVIENEIEKDILAILTPNSKKITCNGKQIKRLSELSELVNVVVFEPKDSLMFNDSPLVRRNYLDVNLSKKSTIYLNHLMKYEALLKERNKTLKLETIDMNVLDVLTDQIIDISKEIATYRAKYIEDLNNIVSKIIAQIKGQKEEAFIRYQPFVIPDENFVKNAKKKYQDSLENDIKHKVTNVGIHREDYQMFLNGNDIASFGSQGENRLAVIALKIAPYFLIEDRAKRPIIVLDDVMSELDANHKTKLIEFVDKLEQVFITSTSTNVKNASVYEVTKNQKINIRRNS